MGATKGKDVGVMLEDLSSDYSDVPEAKEEAKVEAPAIGFWDKVVKFFQGR